MSPPLTLSVWLLQLGIPAGWRFSCGGRQLLASAAAHLCERPDGPTAIGYGGAEVYREVMKRVVG